MTTTPLTRIQLAERYPDGQWRRKLLELLDLVALLRDCIIRDSYRPSEPLIAAIALSDAGRRVRLQLAGKGAGKEGINPNDATVLTLLALVHIEPLIDVEEIDLSKLTEAISEEVRSGALLYPLRFGRELYDRAAVLFKEEREYLNHEETLRLLENQPQGVFHVGHYLIGPYGVIRTEHVRRFTPTTSVPLQHCSDSGCDVVHRIQLTTSREAGVNESRPALNRVLEQVSTEPSEWNLFIDDFTEDDYNAYELRRGATLPALLGDALDNQELREFALFADERLRGTLTSAARAFKLPGQLQEHAANLNRAEILQLLLTVDDSTLGGLLDQCIVERILDVPDGEVRVPRVNGSVQAGAWSVRSELSRFGLRERGGSRELPLLRLSALARSLFDMQSADNMDDLAWATRGTAGNTASEQLEEFLRKTPPDEVVDRLVLTSRVRTGLACSEFQIDPTSSDGDIREQLLWKLGFPQQRRQDVRDRYWELHDGLEALAETAQVDLSATADSLRAASSNYFVALEQFLFDSLAYATWGLLNDHYSSSRPFTFAYSDAMTFAISTLNESNATGDRNVLSDRPQLAQLVRGFHQLSKFLEEIRPDSTRYQRPIGQYPKYASRTGLQRFPFTHTKPFLDLLPNAQVRLIETIKAVAVGLNDSGIMNARNGLLHAGRRVPTVAELQLALQRSRAALDALESVGCVRRTYRRNSQVIDEWGRSSITLASDARTITFSAPSAYKWVKLPSLEAAPFLMHGAVFAAPNEMLRFREGFDSPYFAYWADFPIRPSRGNRVSSDQAEVVTAVDAGSYAASRVT